MVPIQNEGSDRAPEKQGARSTPVPDRLAEPDEAEFRAQLKALWAEIAAALRPVPATSQQLPKVLALGDYLPFESEQPALASQRVSTGKLMMYAVGGLAGITLLTAAIAALRLPPEQCLEELAKISALLAPFAAVVLASQHRPRQVAQIRTA